jgi:phosphate-selective porin OprO/OprP
MRPRLWLCLLGLIPAVAVAQPPSPSPSPSPESVADRLRALEESNRKQAEELERLRSQFPAGPAADPAAPPNEGISLIDGGSPVPDYTEGLFAPFTPPPGYPDAVAKPKGRYPLRASFGPGFRLESEDERPWCT